MANVEEVPKHKYINYLRRAIECESSMNWSFNHEMYFSSTISAIHCAIAASDALCTYAKGNRYVGEDHRNAAYLFSSIDPADENIKRNTKRLAGILSIKTLSEYGSDVATRKQAEQAKLAAERFLAFVKSRLPA